MGMGQSKTTTTQFFELSDPRESIDVRSSLNQQFECHAYICIYQQNCWSVFDYSADRYAHVILRFSFDQFGNGSIMKDFISHIEEYSGSGFVILAILIGICLGWLLRGRFGKLDSQVVTVNSNLNGERGKVPNERTEKTYQTLRITENARNLTLLKINQIWLPLFSCISSIKEMLLFLSGYLIKIDPTIHEKNL